MENRDIDTVVIGGGQAGLTIGRLLQRADHPFVILDANERVGHAWRSRWESLKLFTPAYLNGLQDLRFPGPSYTYVTKDAMADYLEDYASHFQLPLELGTRVEKLARNGAGFIVQAKDRTWHARNVVVAMSDFQKGAVPEFAKDLSPDIVQMHSVDFRTTGQLQPGPVLIVGAGNSGADIAMEVVKTHKTYVAGRDVGHIPFAIDTFIARFLLVRMVRFVGHHVLNTSTPMGRKLRPSFLSMGGPLVRVKPQDLVNAGVERTGRVTEVRDGKPVLADGRVLDVKNVIWATGFTTGFSWIDLPVLDERMVPEHERGIVAKEPGLYFAGLNFQYAATSDTITGHRRDARHVVKHLLRRK